MNYKDLGIDADEAVAVLDDKAARNVAKRLGVKYFGTLKILKNMLDTDILTKPQFYVFIEKLRESGFRFTDAVIRKIIG